MGRHKEGVWKVLKCRVIREVQPEPGSNKKPGAWEKPREAGKGKVTACFLEVEAACSNPTHKHQHTHKGSLEEDALTPGKESSLKTRPEKTLASKFSDRNEHSQFLSTTVSCGAWPTVQVLGSSVDPVKQC